MTTKLGRIGVWTSIRQWPTDPDQVAEAARALEANGYGALWLGSAPGDLALPAAVLDATERLVVATGIVDIWTNPAPAVAVAHHRLVERHPDRFLLGLGSSHAVLVEATGESYVKPLSRLRHFLDELDAADPPVPADQRVLAALGPKALDLAAERSAGAHPYLVTPEYTAQARERLGTGPLLATEQKVVVTTDAAEARRVARRALAIYMELPNYLRNLRRLGFEDADFADGGSDRIVDTLVAWGDVDTVRARVQEQLDAGADHVALQVLWSGDPAALPLPAWQEVATALT
ncbi:MAG TPA: LLM class F420-dependent oxidoreductase [Acidimicrobiales bacterium]